MTVPPEDESWLIDQARTDPEAFALLYERYVERIYAFVCQRTRDRAEAEDLTADTFEKALRALPRYEHQGHSFGAWLYKIAANTLKRHHYRTALLRALLPSLARADEPPPASDLAGLVEEALANLSPADRTLIQLKYIDDLAPEEACFIIGCSRQTYYVRTHRALARLQARVADLAERQQPWPSHR
ncbi:MAG TPA: RNA polymerase sigma factor [Herpetosiphonaceae bacterium]